MTIMVMVVMMEVYDGWVITGQSDQNLIREENDKKKYFLITNEGLFPNDYIDIPDLSNTIYGQK